MSHENHMRCSVAKPTVVRRVRVCSPFTRCGMHLEVRHGPLRSTSAPSAATHDHVTKAELTRPHAIDTRIYKTTGYSAGALRLRPRASGLAAAAPPAPAATTSASTRAVAPTPPPRAAPFPLTARRTRLPRGGAAAFAPAPPPPATAAISGTSKGAMAFAANDAYRASVSSRGRERHRTQKESISETWPRGGTSAAARRSRRRRQRRRRRRQQRRRQQRRQRRRP